MNIFAKLPTDSPTMNPVTSRAEKSCPRPVRSGVVGSFVAGLIVLATLPLSAQTQPEDRNAGGKVQAATRLNVPARKIVLRAKDTVEQSFVRPRVALRGADIEADKAFTPATFAVTYNGFSAAAEDAFQAAVDVWSQLISSPVTIRIEATWEPLETGVLGSAGSTSLWRDFTNAVPGTWYPDALADALFGSDVGGGDFDIVASFNSDRTDWYFGTDGNTQAGEYDLMSVVMHEIGHGLGFLGTMLVDNGADSPECGGTAGHGCWGLGSGFPGIYDSFTQDAGGDFLIDTMTYTNPSAALGSELVGGDVFFSGTAANLANGGTRPELYAPSPWEFGSSYADVTPNLS